MRRVVIISYTEKGRKLNSGISEYLTQNGDVPVSCHYKIDFMSTDELLGQEWKRSSAFIFVSAMGIAVRHIACYMKDKMLDPAVLVMDEMGQFVIPVLSGHIGGGVALARELAGALEARPVITTATDVEERFPADVFARSNHLRIENREQIRKISAALLRGEGVELWSNLPLSGEPPEGVRVRCDADFDREASRSMCLCLGLEDEALESESKCYGADFGKNGQESVRRKHNICILKPGRYIVGIGCKKGKSADELENFLDELCVREGIDRNEIAAVASVDRKREENGIWELSRRLGVPFEVFTAEQLAQVEESVASSEFVRQTLGVDNVCERSAYCLAETWTGRRGILSGERTGIYGMLDEKTVHFRVQWDKAFCRLIAGKQAKNGMTLAVVELAWQERSQT